jgi:hypothetical protein
VLAAAAARTIAQARNSFSEIFNRAAAAGEPV